jgi:hypothetical protein
MMGIASLHPSYLLNIFFRAENKKFRQSPDLTDERALLRGFAPPVFRNYQLRNYGESAFNCPVRASLSSAWIRGSSPRMTIFEGVTDHETPLDIRPRFRYIWRISLIEGRLLEGTLESGARAAPAGGFAPRTRAALGIIHSGTTAGVGGAFPGLG